MTYADWHKIPKALLETLYGHEILRTAGVPADDIFVVLQDGEICILVRTQGREYAFGVDRSPFESEAELYEHWRAAVEAWNGKSGLWGFKQSTIFQNAPYLLLRLEEHGIHVRAKGSN